MIVIHRKSGAMANSFWLDVTTTQPCDKAIKAEYILTANQGQEGRGDRDY